VPLLTLLALLQVTAGHRVSVMAVQPDLMLLVVIAWGLLCGSRQGVIWGFVGGFSLSLFSGAPLGVSALALMAVGALTGLGRARVYRAQLLLPVLATLVTSALHGLLWLLLLYVSGHQVAWLDTIVRVTLPSMVLNSILIVPVYALLRWLHRRLGREELDW
jgi:rod shape-determining protein MreD